jgi:4-hydroxythreonine-4-phosphate dehydrogenase
MGDPAGVGPELALRGAIWAREREIPIALVGSADVLRRVGDRLGLAVPAAVPGDQWSQRPADARSGCVIDRVTPSQHPLLSALQPGQVNALSGALSLQAVEFAIAETVAGRAGGIVTCPIHKTAWQAAGATHPGHTELLGERTGAAHQCMMLAAPSIRCALVTVHVGLSEVPALLTGEAVRRTLELAAAAVARTIGRSPRIAVLGLNPHAGEAGLFGRGEEERAIIPAIAEAREAGWDVRGPLPPDTAFLPEIRDAVDLYICMYHDQGLIPLKALAFDEAVNVTLGLPIVRTSVDHGTALDLAWQGKARPHSLYAAIEMAARLAND